MARFRRTHGAVPEVEQSPESTRPDPAPSPADENLAPATVPRTRTGAAWVAICAAALIAVALIVFLVQNTRTVEISFLGMTGSTSLAVALLIAAVGAALLTVILGTARITQLRRHVRKHPH